VQSAKHVVREGRGEVVPILIMGGHGAVLDGSGRYQFHWGSDSNHSVNSKSLYCLCCPGHHNDVLYHWNV